MMLLLIYLHGSDYSQLLLDLLSGQNNIAYLLPKKFVFALLRRRDGDHLYLNPEVVAEAFMSVEDSLLIVRSENVFPRVHAPSAVFVDLKKSKDEIMSVLFPRKMVLCVQTPSIEAILEAPSSNTSANDNLNVNPEEMQINWKVLEDISEVIYGKQGVALNTLSAAAMIKVILDHCGCNE